ncbi:MAG: hypothetical protein K2H13_05580 [Eubacterium sp.]|nr:hypothetical protein [Eubacterium sp.]MDE6767422.1 hypothetical protein [Eubacterium sp.]
MSDEILKNIWDGGRGLDLTQEQTVREAEIRCAMESCDKQLESVLRKDDWELLERYRNLSVRLCDECEYQAFKVGYKFGVKMVIDALQR